MTLTTQSTTETVEQEGEDEVGVIMSTLPVILTMDEIERLDPWMQDIERTARKLVLSVPAERLTRRTPMAVAAAAVFEAHLYFRASTGVNVAMQRLEVISGATMSMINGAWAHLFKNSVVLSRRLLNRMVVDDSMDLSEMIHAAIVQLRKGVEKLTPAITGWFTRVDNMAVQLARYMIIPDDIHPEVAALCIIYEASHRLLGPRLAKISLKDAREVCGMSEASVSKATKILFPTNGG